MVSARVRMLLRDLWHLRGQVIAAALVVACGIATLVGMASTYWSLLDARRTYYEHGHFADVFAQLTRAPDSLQREIVRIPGIATVETRVVRTVVADVPGLAEPANVRLVSIAGPEGGILNRPQLRLGRFPNAGATDEVVASEPFARANELVPGDRIDAVLNGRWQRLRIVGTALSPEYVYEVAPGALFPDNRRFGVMWMARDVIGPTFDMKGAFDDVAVALGPGAVEPAVRAELDRLLRPYGGLVAYGRSEQTSNRFLADELDEIKVMTGAIPLLFLGVASFLLYVVLSRVVSLQRAEIGLLKAFGYSDVSVGLHYLGLAIVTGGAGLAIGIPGGITLGHWFVGLYRLYFHFPALTFAVPVTLVPWVGLITLLVAAAGALGAVRHAVLLPPAEAMRPEPPARFRPGLLEHLGLLRRVAPVVRMTVRNLMRRPIKALLSVATIALAVALLVVGRLGIDAAGRMLELQFNAVQRDDVTVAFAEARSRGAVPAAARLPGVLHAEGYRAVPVALHAGSRTKRVALLGVGTNHDLRRVVDQRARPVAIPASGVVLGAKLAQILALRPGEVVEIEELDGARRVHRVQVAGVVDELLGLGAYMDATALSGMLREDEAVSGVYLRADASRLAALYAALKRMPVVAGLASREAVLSSVRATMDRSFNSFSIGLTGFAAVIVVGMVYNSMRVALSERAHELASLRVLGFTTGEVSAMLLGEQALVTALAVPVGLLFGYGLCAALIPAFDREAFRLPFVASPRTGAYAALTTCAAALICGLLVARRVRTLDLIAVLKTRE